MENRCSFSYFSLARHDETGDDRPYLEWHQYVHMPEKYEIRGIVGAQRWISTSACRAARAFESDGWSSVSHVTSYLMAEPIEETLDGFFRVGSPRMAPPGEVTTELPYLPNQFQLPLKLLETYASPRIGLAPEVLPYRPNRGVYFVLEELLAPESSSDYPRQAIPDLLAVSGVAGGWVFASIPGLRPRKLHTPGHYRATLLYLDEEPAVVGMRLAQPLNRWLDVAPTKILLAAPFESMTTLDLERFGPGKDQVASTANSPN
jgi:hypothetical protein